MGIFPFLPSPESSWIIAAKNNQNLYIVYDSDLFYRAIIQSHQILLTSIDKVNNT